MEKAETVTVLDNSFTAVGLLFEKEYVYEVQAITKQHKVGPAASVSVSTTSLQGECSFLRTCCLVYFH